MTAIQTAWKPVLSWTSKLRPGRWLWCGTLVLMAGLESGPAQASMLRSAPVQTAIAPTRLARAASPSVTGKLITRDADGRVNLRRQPAIAAPVVIQGKNRASLRILKSALLPRRQRWYFVEHLPTRDRGWVHSDYVRLDQPGQPFTYEADEVLQIEPSTGTIDWDMSRAYGSELHPEGGSITAQDAGAWVNVRSQPSVKAPIRHTALSGDSIYIYEAAKLSSPTGRASELWYFVAFLESGAEGWVRSDFVESAWESDEPFEVHGFGPMSGRLSAPDSQILLYRHMSSSPDSPMTEVVAQTQPGTAVTLLRKHETPRGNPDKTWYRVRLASGTEGWVRGDRVTEGS